MHNRTIGEVDRGIQGDWEQAKELIEASDQRQSKRKCELISWCVGTEEEHFPASGSKSKKSQRREGAEDEGPTSDEVD